MMGRQAQVGIADMVVLTDVTRPPSVLEEAGGPHVATHCDPSRGIVGLTVRGRSGLAALAFTSGSCGKHAFSHRVLAASTRESHSISACRWDGSCCGWIRRERFRITPLLFNGTF